MNRTQWILAAILAVQLLLLAGLRLSGSGGGDDAALRPFLPELESLEAARIEISEGESGSSLALKRGGDRWVLERHDDYPVDPERIEKMIDNLRGLEVRRPVLGSSRYHDTFEVAEDKHQRRLSIWQEPSGDPAVDVFFGSSPNYGTRHARVSGDDRVFELRGLDYYDIATDPGSWIDKQLLDVLEDDVVGVALRNAHGAFELERREGSWEIVTPRTGAALDPSEVESLIASLVGLRLVEPAGRLDPAAQGFEEPSARVELRYQVISETGGQPHETPAAGGEGEAGDEESADAAPSFSTEIRSVAVMLGAPAPGESEGRRYVLRDGAEHAGILSKYEAEELTGARLSDLLDGGDS